MFYMWHYWAFKTILFTNPENEIVKLYGVSMRSPLKRQIKPIGANWLRNGEGYNVRISLFQAHSRQAEEDDRNLDPNSTPNNLTVVTHGDNHGDMIIQNTVIGAKQGPISF